MTQPSVITEVAFTATPFGTLVWTDISAYVDWRAGSFTTTRGRNDELNTTGAGTAGFTLDNRTGRFDPTNATSPYWPYVKPMTPVRVRATYSATTYNVWRGFVERWPQSWQSGGTYGLVQLVAVDGFKATLGFQFADGYNGLVNSQSPGMYNRQVANTALTGWTGSTVPGAINGDSDPGLQLVLAASATAATAPAYNTTGGGLPALVTGGTGSWSAEIWFALDSGTTFTAAGIALPFRFDLWKAEQNATPTRDEGTVSLRAVDTNTLAVEVVTGLVANVTTLEGAAPHLDTGVRIPNDGVYRAIMLQYDNTFAVYRLYVNGILQWTSSPLAAEVVSQSWLNAWAANATGDTTSYTPNLTIRLDEFSLVAGIVSPSQRFAAGVQYATFASELSGARIGHVLDAIGWPAADRVIDTGTVTLQASGSLTGKTALAVIQEASSAESGNVFIDGQGRFVFQDRHHNYTGYTSAATFGEAGFPYLGDIQIEFSDEFIYNDVRIQQANSSPAYVAAGVDVASQSQYGVRSLTGTYPLANTSDVDGIAATLNAIYSQPRPRVAQVTLEGRAHQANFPQMLGREIGDTVTVTRTPIGTTPPITLICVIQGVAHTITSTTWQTKFLLSPTSLYSTWIVGDPTYGVVGSTTIVAF